MAAGSVPMRALPKCRPKPGAEVSESASGQFEPYSWIEMIVGDQVAGRVGSFPIAPESEPQPVPPHAGELCHVLIDHFLAIGTEVPGGAVVGGGREHVVRAEEAYLLLVITPAHHALIVEVDIALRVRSVDRGRKQDRQTEHRTHADSIGGSGRTRGPPAAQGSQPERSPERARPGPLVGRRHSDRRGDSAPCTARPEARPPRSRSRRARPPWRPGSRRRAQRGYRRVAGMRQPGSSWPRAARASPPRGPRSLCAGESAGGTGSAGSRGRRPAPRRWSSASRAGRSPTQSRR